jgi:CRISPR/Cas system-associated exonuclease Cas4 (RecB family)
MLATYRLIRRIKDVANAKYQLKRIELRKEWESKGYQVYFAHELCQCRQKTRFDNMYPELRESIGFKPAVMIGELIETAVKSYLNLEGFDTYKTVGKYVIFGGVDMYDKETNTVYDIKYTTGEPTPKEHHVLRVAIYKWLVGTDNGALIYISPRGFKEFPVTRKISEEEIIDLIENPKSPQWGWECKWCVYADFCNISGNVESSNDKTLDSF